MSPRSEYGGGGIATVPTAHREAAGTSLEQGLVVDEVDLEHGCGGNSFRRRGSTSLGCLHHRAGPLALLSPPFLPPPPHARRLELPKTQHRRAGTVLSFIFGRMESRGVATEWESPKTLRRDLRMQISPASLVGSGLPGRAPPLSRIPACCPSPTERPYYSHLRERRFGVGSAGAGLAPFASSLHSTKPAEVAAPCSGKVLSFGEAFSQVPPRSWARPLPLSRGTGHTATPAASGQDRSEERIFSGGEGFPGPI